MTNDDEPKDSERMAYALAKNIEAARTEATKWNTLAENVENDTARALAQAYRDTWQEIIAKQTAQLKDLDAQVAVEGRDGG